jgi:hypothetical protein
MGYLSFLQVVFKQCDDVFPESLFGLVLANKSGFSIASLSMQVFVLA